MRRFTLVYILVRGLQPNSIPRLYACINPAACIKRSYIIYITSVRKWSLKSQQVVFYHFRVFKQQLIIGIGRKRKLKKASRSQM